MSSEPWCDFNDMPQSGCAHCKGIPDERATRTLEHWAHPLVFTRSITARFDGQCPGGDHRIHAGETIHFCPEMEAWFCQGCVHA